MTFPRHAEALCQAEVQIPETRTTKIISLTDLSAYRISKRVQNCIGLISISEKTDGRAARIYVPMQRGVAIEHCRTVEDEPDRERTSGCAEGQTRTVCENT